jgi:hypothetical protein
MPVASTAAPDARKRIREPIVSASPLSTSITSIWNSDGTVPWTTDSALQRMPGLTSASFMIGSAALAAGTMADTISATEAAIRTLIRARLSQLPADWRR